MTEKANDRARRPRLAEVYEPGRPGLPRGRSSLPRTAVRDAQRARLMRAAIAAVAEKGYASTTVADVVGRARVSRKAFYEHFPDLERCFLASLAGAQRTILRRLASVPPDRGRDEPGPRGTLRSGARAYLELCAQEPEFARCILVELPAVGPRALKGRNKGYRQVAALLRTWRERAGEGWPPVPEEMYLAAVGAISELIQVRLADGDPGGLPDLEDAVTEVLVRLLAVPAPPDAP